MQARSASQRSQARMSDARCVEEEFRFMWQQAWRINPGTIVSLVGRAVKVDGEDSSIPRRLKTNGRIGNGEILKVL